MSEIKPSTVGQLLFLSQENVHEFLDINFHMVQYTHLREFVKLALMWSLKTGYPFNFYL